MKTVYRHPEWVAFRQQVIALDGGACTRCPRTEKEGAVLQVHHKVYHPGKLPWQYRYQDCTTLCKGCHAEEHGHIRPRTGWQFICQEDLEDLIGSCEKCGTSIRYVFHIHHQHWEPLAVGTMCCDDLTGTNEASRMMRKIDRKVRFIQSRQWKLLPDGQEIKRSQIRFKLKEQDGRIRIYIGKRRGASAFDTIEEARARVFDLLDDGTALKLVEEYNIPLELPMKKGRRSKPD